MFRAFVFVTLTAPSGAFFDMTNPFTWGEKAAPAPARGGGGGVDMSATFAKLRSCSACIGAGYGWCPMRRKCGGFANKECGLGPQYVAEGTAASPPRAAADQRKRTPTPAAQAQATAGGTDMRATFAKLRTCDVCIGAGYGWCPMQRKCGGFANRECGAGPNYVSDAPAAAASAPSGSGNFWVPKARRASDDAAAEPPVADVPAASPPPAASMLYAGPVKAAGASQVTVGAGGAAAMGNGTEEPAAPSLEGELLAMGKAELVRLVVAQQAELKGLRAL